ncbi:MAG: hypothetical protein WCB46_12530 [Methanoregula sp.]
MTGIAFHKIRRTARHHLRHTYLIDVGTAIEVPLVDVSNLFENCILSPPFQKTRYFEIEIDELHDGKKKTALFQNIFPVRVKRKPDWRILKFRVKHGSWIITERIQFPTDTGEAQWLYTDDFNILFLSSAGSHDLDLLIDLITGKLNAIARSFHERNRVASEFENQLTCRNVFDTLFSDGVDGAFRDAVIYQDYGLIVPEEPQRDIAMASGAETCNHRRSGVSSKKAGELHVDINEIEDLRDLSWIGY